MVSVKDTVQEKINSNTLFVFSKSYCPFCAKTKALLDSIGAKYEAIELDQVSDGDDMQDAVEEISGQRTVPNVFVSGKSIGGNSEVQKLHKAGNLEPLLREKGVVA